MTTTVSQDALLSAVLAEIGSMPYADVLTGGGALLALIGEAILKVLGVETEGKANVTFEADEVTEVRVTWGTPGGSGAAQPALDEVRSVVAEMLAHITSGDDYADPAKISDWRERAGIGEASR